MAKRGRGYARSPFYCFPPEQLRSVLSSDDVTDLMTSGAMMTENEAIAQAHSLELE